MMTQNSNSSISYEECTLPDYVLKLFQNDDCVIIETRLHLCDPFHYTMFCLQVNHAREIFV